ncbi:MAG: M1 family metallopeptidase [Flavobacteriales bacterium]
MKQFSYLVFLISGCLFAQTEHYNNNKFKQLKEELATPNVYRTGGGAPGHKYYQNQANYSINITLNDELQRITGSEEIEYINNSPDALEYIWLQLDQNVRSKTSDSKKIRESKLSNMSFDSYKRMHNDFDGGFKIEEVESVDGKKFSFTVNKTMMRLDLENALQPGETIKFKVDWWYNINDRMQIGGRSGYEYFTENDNYLYTIAQFYPRMCVYNDVEGWQNKQFLGNGEFTLPFGDYDVNITVPSDHVVAATGMVQNFDEVLTSEQKKRFDLAKKTYDEPVLIITQEEAEKAEKKKVKTTKTWHYKAENVRDFAFASSRKFMWDAMAVKQETKDVLAMSYYPKEGNPVWEKYSTHAVAQTLETYSRHTFDYPYPVAISVNSKSIGMEYPMICFNFGRPEKDGTYTAQTKYGVIGVIIHEVGHNYFPMIINSDERQWTWMDEGLNTFLQYLTEQDWEDNYPSRRGPARKIVNYMKGDKNGITPIMTNSESLLQFGNNAYGKPAAALNILRETVMGRELFDHAFKTYAQRWMFKHPTPADFFRTMEDASAVDLDWFWRGWFYTTDHVDIALNSVKYFQASSGNPKIEKGIKAKQKKNEPVTITDILNKKESKKTRVGQNKSLADFYNTYDVNDVTKKDKNKFAKAQKGLNAEQKSILKDKMHYYELEFENVGGLVMPLIVEFEFDNGKKEIVRIPAEIWVRDNFNVSKVFYFKNRVVGITLDPYLETADTDVDNNVWPKALAPTRFEIYKSKQNKKPNAMQQAQ